MRSGEELQRSRHRHLELEGVEHHRLHLQDLPTRISAVGDVDEVADLREVDLLVLGGEEHARDADELEALARDHLLLEKAIDEVDREVERLRR